MREAPEDVDAAKASLRVALLAARRTRGPAYLAAAADALRDRALADLIPTLIPALTPAPTVALYASTGTEPGTHPLLAALYETGTRVLLPALRPDLNLDWGVYVGPGSLVPGPRGTLEPAGERLGLDALGEAELVLVPGLAADRRGHRLGRGGGSYDRALRRAHPATWIVVLLHTGEMIDTVPARGHDVRVHGVLTPEGFETVGAEGEEAQ